MRFIQKSLILICLSLQMPFVVAQTSPNIPSEHSIFWDRFEFFGESGSGLVCTDPFDLSNITGPAQLIGKFPNSADQNFSCGGLVPRNVAWFSYTPQADGAYRIFANNATPTNAWSRLAVTQGLSCNPYGNEVTCVTRNSRSIDAQVKLSAGQPYLIAFFTDGPQFTMVDPTVSIPICGNGIREDPEECDGKDLGGTSCGDLPGFQDGGVLACNAQCQFDTSQCIASPGISCSNPFDVSNLTGPVQLTGVFSQNAPGPFSCGGSNPTNVAWFSFTPQTDGPYRLEANNATTTSAFSRLAVVQGLSCDPYGNEVTCVTSASRSINTLVDLSSGQPYLIAFFTDGQSFTMVDPTFSTELQGQNSEGGTESRESSLVDE